jgi:hypothetical protein
MYVGVTEKSMIEKWCVYIAFIFIENLLPVLPSSLLPYKEFEI